MNFSLKTKLNCSDNFSEELECAFGVLEKIFLDEQDLMEFIW